VIFFLQVELTGNNISEYIHPHDQEELANVLSLLDPPQPLPYCHGKIEEYILVELYIVAALQLKRTYSH